MPHVKRSIHLSPYIPQALVLDPRIDANKCNRAGISPLKAALIHNHTKIALYLLQETSNLAVSNQSLLHIAAAKDDAEVIAIMLENHPAMDVNERDPLGTGQTAIMVASEHGHFKAAEALLKSRDIDLFAKDQEGYPALLLAATNGHRRMLRLLKRHLNKNKSFSKQNASNNSGWSPLAEATLYGRTELVMELLYCNG